MSLRVVALTLGLLAAVPAFAPSGTAVTYPRATEWSPTGSDVSVDASILITWTEQMSAPSVELAFSLSGASQTWNASAFQWIHANVPPWTSKATPRFPLPVRTNFTATVLPSAHDVNGYPIDQDQDGVGGEPTDRLVWTFRTENGTPPRVVATTPPDGATNVSVAASITLAFDEPMDTASVAAAFAVSPPAPGAIGWTDNGTRATFAPALYLRYGTVYQVRLNGSIASDANGRPLDGDGNGVGGDDFTLAFTTVPDQDLPRALAVTPTDGTVNVSATTNLVLRFSEPMDTGSVESALSFTDGTSSRDASDGAFAWRGRTFPDDEVTFNPYANLPFAARITVALNASRARDPSGFTLDGNGDNVSQGSPTDDRVWTFRTEARDTTPPTVTAIDPPDGALDVPETIAITWTFSEAMNASSVEDAFSVRDSVRTWTKDNGTFSWARGGDGTTYTPAATFSPDREYLVTLLGSAQDVNGNPMGGIQLSTFHTRPPPDTSPPHVVSTIPGNGGAGVAREPVISITFDDPMDRPATEGAISLARVRGLNATTVPIEGFQWDGGGQTVSFRPSAPLTWGSLHRVTISQGARDAAGLAIESAFSFGFWTAPWSGRVIGRVVDGSLPVAGATVSLETLTIQTDANGSFAFPTVPAGTYNLTIAKDGYTTRRELVTLDPASASADLSTIDLGTFSLERTESLSVPIVLGIFGTALAVFVLLGLLVRRRRGPPLSIDEPEADAGLGDEAWAEGRSGEP